MNDPRVAERPVPALADALTFFSAATLSWFVLASFPFLPTVWKPSDPVAGVALVAGAVAPAIIVKS